MKNKNLILFTLILASFSSVTAYAHDALDEPVSADYQKPPAMNEKDPYEHFNRAIYSFNIGFNDTIGQPVAEAYNDYVPLPVRTGFDNFFNNLKEPLNMINGLLQGNVEGGLTSLMRFSINSTLGLFGLIDIASEAGLEYQKEDFGQTLYTWGFWTESSFIMLPIVGPYTTRELVGGVVDTAYDPIYPDMLKTDADGRLALFVGQRFVDYAEVIHLTEEVKAQPDPYIFVRESYMQYRTNLIYNGNPPQPNLDDFNFE